MASIGSKLALRGGSVRFAVSLAMVGVVTGVLSTIFALSFAGLLFSGELKPHIGTGIGVALVGAVIVGLVIPFTSSQPGVTGALVAEPAIILGLALEELATGVAAERLLPTALVAIMVAGVTTGCTMLLIGWLRLGRVAQYIPFPVFAGLIAGLGVLLMQGGFGFVLDAQAGSPLSWTANPWNETTARLLLVAGVGLGVWLLQRYRPAAYNVPLVLAACLVLFWLVFALGGLSSDQARAAGWLLGPFPDHALWSPRQNVWALANADWAALLTQAPKFAVIAVLLMIIVLVDAGSIELITKRANEPDQALTSTGFANLCCGVAGGFLGAPSISGASLTAKAGTPHRGVGVIAAGACASVLVGGADLLSTLPSFVVGGLLFYIGFDFVYVWLWRLYGRLTWSDSLVLMAVFVTVVTLGFMEGFAVGLGLGFVMFVIDYSHLDVVKQATTGDVQFSNVDRPSWARERIRAAGAGVLILKLQGYLFFGTANRILERVRTRLADLAARPLRWLVIDLKLTDGLDASAMVSLLRLLELGNQHGFSLILCNPSRFAVHLLAQYGMIEQVRVCPDLDHGLEWVEEQTLAADPLPPATEDPFRLLFGHPENYDKMCRFFDPLVLAPGDHLIRQGEKAEDMYLIRSGRVSIRLETDHGHAIRLRTALAGSIVGEIAAYLGTRRTASVIADGPVRAWRISTAALEAMGRHDPALLTRYQDMLIRYLAARLTDANRLIADLYC